MELRDILGTDDVTEPACMERLLMYLEQLQIEDEEFMELLLDKVGDNGVTWEQPWYQHSTCLTRRLEENEGNGLEKFRTDTISKAENDQIEKNWRKFIKKYDVPDKLICFARWRNKDKSRNPRTPEEKVRQFVTAYLARGLERNLYQVYKHIVMHYSYPNRGYYTDTEQRIMEVCFQYNPGNAVVYLSHVLGRQPRGISKRLFHDKPECTKRLKWTIELADKYLKLLMKHSERSLEELKYESIDKSVWLKLEEDMDHPYIYLQNFWYHYLHVQLFVKCDVKLKRLRKKIFKILKSSSYQVWTDIRWKQVLQHFPDGFTHYFLYKAVTHYVASYSKKYRTEPLDDVITYALNRVKSLKNKRLRSLAFGKDGNLEVVKYDAKLVTK